MKTDSTETKVAPGADSSPSPVREYYVNVTLRIPHKLLGKITKKTIATKDVEIVAADWGRVREIYSANTEISGGGAHSAEKEGSK
jgi:hypothetical protein